VVAAVLYAGGPTAGDDEQSPLVWQLPPQGPAAYRQEGDLLFQVLRKRDKAFACRRPLPGGDWAWNLTGIERVRYRLPEALAAIRAGERVATSSALRPRVRQCRRERPAPGPSRSVAVAAGDNSLALLGAAQRRLRDAGLRKAASTWVS
jgi:hypothetical protein